MPNEKESKGIVYVAHGSVFLEEAIVSASQCKTLLPDIPICIITDQETEDSVFDHIIHLEYKQFHNDNINVKFGYKPYALSQTDLPFEKCLFLDTDTYLLDPGIRNLFSNLHEFDICMVQDHEDDQPSYKYPSGIIYNSGFILFNNNEKIQTIFNQWWNRMKKRINTIEDGYGRVGDQGFLTDIIYSRPSLNLLPLLKNYNFRFNGKQYIAGLVRVLHGRANSFEYNAIAYELNYTNQERIWDPETKKIEIIKTGTNFINSNLHK